MLLTVLQQLPHAHAHTMDDYEERQEDEVEFLQAVFPGDFQDLRLNDPWKVGGLMTMKQREKGDNGFGGNLHTYMHACACT